ncbi:hypothetical protein BASA81_013762 [Batrachochytrium salamandrivorans]|nr:hypothetical protein BASA81_013762 [Batrachochytrium salamandrivorans]
MATSLHILRSFLSTLPDRTVDASQIHSRECYLAWLGTRNAVDCDAERKKFHRSLTNHLSGVDGRCPFDQHEEEAILRVLRRKERWPCFPELSIGINFRAKGFHEKQNAGKATSAASSPPSPVFVAPSPPSEKRARMDDLSPRDQALLLDLGKGFAEFTSAFAPFGIDVRTSIFGILRFCISFGDPGRYTSLPEEQRLERGREICSQVTLAKGPLASVTVCDWLSKDALFKVLVQNAQSRETAGELGGESGLDILQFTSGRELYELTQTIGTAYLRPGVEFPIYPGVFFMGQKRMNMTSLWLDPESGLMVSIAMPDTTLSV